MLSNQQVKDAVLQRKNLRLTHPTETTVKRYLHLEGCQYQVEFTDGDYVNVKPISSIEVAVGIPNLTTYHGWVAEIIS